MYVALQMKSYSIHQRYKMVLRSRNERCYKTGKGKPDRVADGMKSPVQALEEPRKPQAGNDHNEIKLYARPIDDNRLK